MDRLTQSMSLNTSVDPYGERTQDLYDLAGRLTQRPTRGAC